MVLEKLWYVRLETDCMFSFEILNSNMRRNACRIEGQSRAYSALTGAPALPRAGSVWSRRPSMMVPVSSSSCVTTGQAAGKEHSEKPQLQTTALQTQDLSILRGNERYLFLITLFTAVGQILRRHFVWKKLILKLTVIMLKKLILLQNLSPCFTIRFSRNR